MARQDGRPEVRSEMRTESKAIPFETEYQLSRSVVDGRQMKARDGKSGRLDVTYKYTFAGTKLVRRELVKSQRTEPQSAVILLGTAGRSNSRGGTFRRDKVLEMSATAYDPSAGRGKAATGRTACGVRATLGIAAVDPRVIPLGSELFIEGYGYARAMDRGSAIVGNRIDLCYDSYSAAMRFGRKKVRVYILRSR